MSNHAASPSPSLDPLDEEIRLRRQISHDIHHELATIMLLASLLQSASDVGADSRDRARQLLGETRWLHRLHLAYDETVVRADSAVRSPAEPVRLDLLAGEVVAAMQLSTLTRIGFTSRAVWAHVDRLGFWRGLRNLVGNAVRAAGAGGHVEVRVTAEPGWAVAEIDDDGPGFGGVPAGHASLGLGIVQDLAAAWGGELEITRGMLGGCCVRLRLPSSPPARDWHEAGAP
jgi:signal transduction histidine kinase